MVPTSSITPDPEYQNPVIKKNAKYKVGNFQYQVTKASTNGTGTVKLIKVLKKTKTVSVPSTIKISGIRFKVTEIKASVFKNNKTMTKLTIGSNVTTIGDKAFYGCTKLETITIGKNVKKIGKQAFYNCKVVKKMTISSTKLAASQVGAKAFTKMGSKDYSKLEVKLPSGKKQTYKKFLKSKGLSKKAKIK